MVGRRLTFPAAHACPMPHAQCPMLPSSSLTSNQGWTDERHLREYTFVCVQYPATASPTAFLRETVEEIETEASRSTTVSSALINDRTKAKLATLGRRAWHVCARNAPPSETGVSCSGAPLPSPPGDRQSTTTLPPACKLIAVVKRRYVHRQETGDLA